MADCVFCRIIAGEIPATRVYEDEHVVAILDIFPTAEGHTLVIPKRHEALLPDLPFTDATHVFSVVRKLDGALRHALSCEAISILLRDGPAAGQEVAHLHVHLIPRMSDDGLGPAYPSGKEKLTSDDAERIHTAIGRAL